MQDEIEKVDKKEKMKRINLIAKISFGIIALLGFCLRVYAAPPQGRDVQITQPVRMEHEVFGRANYFDSDGDRESGSTYEWYKGISRIASGVLSKVMLIHFDGNLTSEEGYTPTDSSGISYVEGMDGREQGAVEIGQGDVLAYNWPNNDCPLTGSQEATIEFWVKPYWDSYEKVTNNPDNQLFYENAGGNNYISLYRTASTMDTFGELRFIPTSEGAPPIQRIINWEANTWHYVAITLENYVDENLDKVTIYVDGQPSRTFFRPERTLPGSKFYLGSNGSGKYFNGAIDELRISNRKLSRDEINLRFQRREPFFSQETMLELDDAGFNPGDQLIFKYTPQSADGLQGSQVSSPPETIQSFTSSINIDVTGQLARLNRDLLGAEFWYDDHEPGAPEEGGEGSGGGCGNFLWDRDLNAPREMTVNRVKPLKLGLSQVEPWYYPYVSGDNCPDGPNSCDYSWPPRLGDTQLFIDRMMEFADQADMQSYSEPEIAPYIFAMHRESWGEPGSEPQILYGYESCNYGSCTNPYAYKELVHYVNIEKGYKIKYWEVTNEPVGAEDVAIQNAVIYGEVMKQADPSIHIVTPVTIRTANLVFEYVKNNDPDHYVDDFSHTDGYLERYIPESEYYYPSSYFITNELYPDLVGSSVEQIRENYEYVRNKMRVYFPGEDRKLMAQEYNIHYIPTGVNNAYELNIHMTGHTLLGAIARASFTNMLLKTNVVDSAYIFGWGFAPDPFKFLNRPGNLNGRSPDGNPSVTYLHSLLYADFLGDKLANVDVDTYSFDTPGNPWFTGNPLPPYQNLPSLDVLSTISNDGSKLYMIVVNRDIAENGNITARINLNGFTPQDTATKRYINVDNQAHNHGWPDMLLESITYGPLHFTGQDDYYDADAIPVIEETISGVSGSFEYTFPSHSITAFEFTANGGPGNSAPVVTISSPEQGASFYEEDIIIFSGNAWDNEQGNLSGNLIWTSNLDGEIGRGAGFQRTLSIGDHQITAQVTDSGNPPLIGSAYVDIQVREGSPDPDLPKTFSANHTNSAIIIDGQKDPAYDKRNNAIVDRSNTTWGYVETDSDLRGGFTCLWDEENLYVIIKVVDDVLADNSSGISNIWKDDSVELYLDGLHDASGPYGIDDHQYTVDLANQLGGVNSGVNGQIEHAVAKVENGYLIEYKIPFANLEIDNPQAFQVIGFDFGINDDDDLVKGSDRDAQIMWNGDYDNYMDTSDFGELILIAPLSGPRRINRENNDF